MLVGKVELMLVNILLFKYKSWVLVGKLVWNTPDKLLFWKSIAT